MRGIRAGSGGWQRQAQPLAREDTPGFEPGSVFLEASFKQNVFEFSPFRRFFDEERNRFSKMGLGLTRGAPAARDIQLWRIGNVGWAFLPDLYQQTEFVRRCSKEIGFNGCHS